MCVVIVVFGVLIVSVVVRCRLRLFVVCSSLFVVCCSLFVVCGFLLFVVRCVFLCVVC